MSKQREFTIPEIKAARKISSKNEPSLFKTSTKASSNPPSSTSTPSASKSLNDQHDSSAAQPSVTMSRVTAIDSGQSSSSKQPSSLEKDNAQFFAARVETKGLSTSSKEATADESQPGRSTGDGQSAASANLCSSASTSVSTYRPHAIVVNIVQKKNPLMKHVRNVPWEVGNIVPDFELGKTTCALFLSVRYHSLHPNYIHERLKSLGKQYTLRVLLVLVDTSESQKVLHDLAKIALLADLTLILSWSYEEAARYLETYKAYENKPPDMIMERIDSDSSSRVIECLTTVKKVNKTDAATLMNTFKSMEKLVMSSKEELTLCPGLGPLKAQRLHDLFHEPFLKSASKKPS